MKENQSIHGLLTRGVEEIIDKEHLETVLRSGKKLRVKLGFDPTGAKIHLGRAVVLRKLREFQELGHTAVFIVGDFTALIGDPSDKLGKRPMLAEDEVKENLESYKSQVAKIVDLKKAEFHHNSRWLKKINFHEIAALAESFSVQQMLARRNFKERWQKNEEISLRELLYPLMQGYDSVMVKADLEIGGFDQLFNLKAGRIIQHHYGQPEQDILTCAMLEGTDGRKMSTSWGNVINIVDVPTEMFGKIMSLKDELMEKYFLLSTNLEINEIKNALTLGPRDAKLKLAETIVAFYHGKNAAEKARGEFQRVFQRKEKPEAIKEISVKEKKLPLVDLLIKSKLAQSKSEARRLILQGGVKINSEKKTDPLEQISLAGEILIQVGPRRFLKIKSG